MRHLTGFAPLAKAFEGFIIDLWGVIHDGVTPYDGAVDCLARIAAAGKRTVLLSNAPRRADVARAGMRAMGIADHLYTSIMTSGEATHGALRDRPDGWWRALGGRVFHLGPARDRNVMEGTGLVPVRRPEDATFVLNTGPDDERDPSDIGPFLPILDQCRARGLPMVCANPDIEVIRGGTRVICAGALAMHYEALGGVVRSLGKPDPAIYRPVLETLGVGAERVLAVGDSLRTDIAGAANAAISSCWVLGGIHAEALDQDPELREAMARDAGLSPSACIPRFVW